MPNTGTPEVEQRRIELRGALGVDAGRAAGEHHRQRVAGLDLLDRGGVRHDLGVDPRLAHPAGDQLRILRPEVDDQHGPGRRCTAQSGSAGFGHEPASLVAARIPAVGCRPCAGQRRHPARTGRRWRRGDPIPDPDRPCICSSAGSPAAPSATSTCGRSCAGTTRSPRPASARWSCSTRPTRNCGATSASCRSRWSATRPRGSTTSSASAPRRVPCCTPGHCHGGDASGFRHGSNMNMHPTGGHLGLPGDFLIGPDGRVLACKHGRHANDQWSVDELLALRLQRKRLTHRGNGLRVALEGHAPQRRLALGVA